MEENKMNNDTFTLGGHTFESRFILGSGKYSLDLIKAAVEKAGAQIITLALRRANEGGMANILDYIPENVTLLPNTSGARNAEEAVRIARLSRELGCGDFVKIEVIHDSKYLFPDNYETIKAKHKSTSLNFVSFCNSKIVHFLRLHRMEYTIFILLVAFSIFFILLSYY